MSNQVILYVEDEEDYQLLAKRILGNAGFDVRVADDGASGLAALKQQRPDLLILDVNLPDSNGYDLCRQLRRTPEYSDLPILLLTVRRRPEEWLKGFSSGADDYVSKPLNPPDLVERVRTCLEIRRPHQDQERAEYQLIQAALSGNKSAFEVLVQQYRERLMDHLRASGHNVTDAEDLVAATFARAYERLGQFRGQSAFYTWIYRIAKNESHHLHRKRSGVSLEEIAGGDETTLPAGFSEPDRMNEALSEQTIHVQLQRAVTGVPKPYRELLSSHVMRGLSYETLARKYRIPAGTVMSRLFKAKKLLRKSWEDHNGR